MRNILEKVEARLRRSEGRRSGDLSGREPGAGGSCLPRVPLALGSSVLIYGPGGCRRICPSCCRFSAFPGHLWRKLRTTNVIERCFVEVRGRTRPMVCFVNVESVDRIIYSIFQRFNLEWKTRTLNLFTQAT